MVVDTIVFMVGAVLAIVGALGVVTVRNPVRAALLLIVTLFGVAILFVSQEAHFLAAVQVIVYAGAVVVLFLFVIMLLGVDRDPPEETEPIKGQRTIAVVLGVLVLVGLVVVTRYKTILGTSAVAGAADGAGTNVEKIGESLFTRYLFAFEITSVLLVIAVAGAVLLARRPETELPVEGTSS